VASHLDHLHNADGDFGDADAVGFAAGQGDLDRLRGCCSYGLNLRHQPSPSIWPVKAAEIRAER